MKRTNGEESNGESDAYTNEAVMGVAFEMAGRVIEIEFRVEYA